MSFFKNVINQLNTLRKGFESRIINLIWVIYSVPTSFVEQSKKITKNFTLSNIFTGTNNNIILKSSIKNLTLQSGSKLIVDTDSTLLSTNLIKTYLTLLNRLYLNLVTYIRNVYWRSFSFGYYYIQGFVFLLFIDACLTDDEPL